MFKNLMIENLKADDRLCMKIDGIGWVDVTIESLDADTFKVMEYPDAFSYDSVDELDL